MANKALHSAVDEMSPQITELAQNSGQSPETFLRAVVEAERRKQVGLAKLDDAVAEADASGFHEIKDLDVWAEGVKARGRARLA